MDHKICIFGDSIVYGAGVDVAENWAALLRRDIQAKEEWPDIYNLGIGAETSAMLLKRLDIELTARKPGMIIFGIGTNDSLFRTRGRETTDQQFVENIQELIRKALQFTQQIYFVGLAMGDEKLTNPIDQSDSGKCYSRTMVARYDLLLKMVVEENNLTYIRIAHVMEDSDFIDGLHPNSQGHVKIYQEIKNTIKL